MRKPYIGVSGFMHADEVRAVLEVVPSTHTLMVGVLMSEKTAQGKTNKYPNRYPKREHVGGIFVSDPRCLNLIHYASDTPPAASDIWDLVNFGGRWFDGFQFNGAWPTVAALRTAFATRTANRVVLQLRELSEANLASDDLFPPGMPPYVTDVLLDASGGRGRAFNLARMQAAVATMRACHNGFGVGVAGGWDAANVCANKAFFRKFPGLSVDAEGRLRDENDRLDIDKARAFVVETIAAQGEG